MILNQSLQVFLIICSVVFWLIVINYSIKRKLSVRYGILWFLLSILFIVISLFPNIVNWFCSIVSIREPIHAVELAIIAFILLVIFTYNCRITKLTDENRMLIQEIGILKKYVSDLEEK